MAKMKPAARRYADDWKKFLEDHANHDAWKNASQGARTLAQLIVMGRGVLLHSTDGTGHANWGPTAQDASRGRRVWARRRPLNERQVVYGDAKVLGIGAPTPRPDSSLLALALTVRTESVRVVREELEKMRQKRLDQKAAKALGSFAEAAVATAKQPTPVR